MPISVSMTMDDISSAKAVDETKDQSYVLWGLQQDLF